MKRVFSFLLMVAILASCTIGLASDKGVICYFDDIPPSQGASSPFMAAQYLYEKGIINGKDERNFMPNDFITREEFTKIIIGAMRAELTDKTGTFSDVVDGSWYEPYVETANENGIMRGVGDSIFGVGSNVTRQDAAVIVYRLYQALNIPTEGLDTYDKEIKDESSISDYAVEAIKSLTKLGTIDLVSDKIMPTDSITRGDAAKFVYRMLIADETAYHDRVQKNIPREKPGEEYPRKILALEDFEGDAYNSALPSVPEVSKYKADMGLIDRTTGYNSSSSVRANSTRVAMFFEVEPSSTYRADWMVKAEEMDGVSYATVYFSFYDKNGVELGGHHDRMGVITSDTDWKKQSFECTSPTPDKNPAYLLLLFSSGGGGQGVIHFDDVVVSQTVYDPLITVMSSPNYKGLIYEENGENDINVGAYFFGMKEILDFDNLNLIARVLDGDNNVIMHSEQKGLSEEMSVCFSSKYLNIGDYYLRISLINPDTGEEIAYDEWTLRKRASDFRPQTYFDEYGRLVRNGKPMFVTGVYAAGVTPDVIDDFKDMPLDICFTIGISAWWNNRTQVEEDYNQHDLSFMFTSNCLKNNPKGGQTYGQTSIASERPIIEKHVEYLKQAENKALFGYIVEDEYAYAKWAERVGWHTDILSELDLDHPTFGVGSCSRDACYAWYKAEDIHSADPYIIYGKKDDPIELVYKYAKELHDYTPNRPTWMTLQGCDLSVFSPDYAARYDRGPNEQEFRNQIWQSVCGGSQGVIWYSHFDLKKDGADRPFEDYWADIERTVGEAKKLENVILSVEDAPIVSVKADNDDMLCYTTRRYDGKTYVFVVNMLHQAQNVSVMAEGAKSIYGIYSDKNYAADKSGTFSATLNPLGVDIFIIDQDEYLSPVTDIKAIGFSNERESYIVYNNNNAKDCVLNVPEGLEEVDFGINTTSDKIKVFVNGTETGTSGTIQIKDLSEINIKIQAEDSRYFDEYKYIIQRS